MRRPISPGTAVLLLAVAAASARAQDIAMAERCITPDTLMVRGTVRTSPATVLALSGFQAGTRIAEYTAFPKAIKAIFDTGEYEDPVMIECEIVGPNRTALVVVVRERPVLRDIRVTGARTQTQRTVEERVELFIGRPVDPALVARAITRIDSLYQTSGYNLVRITPDTTVVDSAGISLNFRIEEGRRMAIAGLKVSGANLVTPSEVAGAMKTRPEGWWWFRSGEFDEQKYMADLGEHLPALYARKGLLDFQLLRDTVIVDRERGKGFIELEVSEGEQYHIGTFTLRGNRHFSEEQLRRFAPFADDGLTLAQRAMNAIRRRKTDPTVFDNDRFASAVDAIRQAYANDGYIYADVVPIIERARRADSTPVINMRLEFEERSPAIINRINIIGNDYTTEHCIRDMLEVIPGGVFNQQALISSYQRISNLGFFETPIKPPVTIPVGDDGLVDLTFELKEKRTGTINFGASMGQGTGVGGFVGLEQPNLFGRCKRGTLNWQFGQYINDFNLAYTDPAIRLSQISGTINVYRSQARYQIADLGQTTRTGGSLRVGLPVPGTFRTRGFVSYTGEAVKYGSGGLLGTVSECTNCFRSALGFDLTKETRFGLPFPIGGSLQSFSAQFNGGILGGSANFQRYSGEYRAYAPIKELGGTRAGSQPIIVAIGLSARAGAVIGNTGPFFFSQRFALGGVQFGEPLRGYPEFSITPRGFLTGTSTYNAQRESFGSSFFASTVELGVRFSSQFYVNMFYDAGNLWETPREFDPTRLFRGAGIGLSTVTPLGPLGLDWAYGFDRLDSAGRRDPRWQLHFRLGQLF